jgi:hypothetical protein
MTTVDETDSQSHYDMIIVQSLQQAMSVAIFFSR